MRLLDCLSVCLSDGVVRVPKQAHGADKQTEHGNGNGADSEADAHTDAHADAEAHAERETIAPISKSGRPNHILHTDCLH